MQIGVKVLPIVSIDNSCHIGASVVVVEDVPEHSTCVMQQPEKY